LHNSEVSFRNNDAERELRMMKCKQKISGGFRTHQGAAQFARMNTKTKWWLDLLKNITSIVWFILRLVLILWRL
jgi:hypothetical protein